jgi:hypothetical protein
MKSTMKQIFRLFRRNGIYYSHASRTDEQISLRTHDKVEVQRLCNAKNEAAHNPSAVNVQIARTYVAASNPEMLTRTWRSTFDAMTPLKKKGTYSGALGTSRERHCLLVDLAHHLDGNPNRAASAPLGGWSAFVPFDAGRYFMVKNRFHEVLWRQKRTIPF